MGKALQQQHPAVVLRSRYDQLRALLAVALVALVGLTVAVAIVANEGDDSIGANSAQPAAPEYGDFRADGRPQAGPRAVPETNVDTGVAPRYDGGPEEGTPEVTPSGGKAFELPRSEGVHPKWPVRGALPPQN